MGVLLVFHGADYKVGTTMISQSVSELVAKKYPHCKVLRLAMNSRKSCDFVQEPIPSLEGFRKSLDSSAVLGEAIFRRYHIKDNLYAIAGLEKEINHRKYFPEDAYRIIKSLGNEFDFIVVDGGCDIDNGLVLGSLTMGAINILILSQNESVLYRWEQQETIYKDFSISFDFVIVNKYQHSHPYSLGYIKERLGFKDQSYYKIKLSAHGYRAEWEKKTLIHYGINSFKTQISEIIKGLKLECPSQGKKV